MARAGILQNWNEGLASCETPALAFIELSSISRGLVLTDVILKKAPVRVITSQPVSSGKHVILFFGDVASVEESYQAAIEQAEGCVVKQILIPAVHTGLVPYLDSLWEMDPTSRSIGDSVGIAESTTMAGAILAADRALKTANVLLCRMRLGQGIGGRAYFVVSGRQEEVEAASDSARLSLQETNSLARVDVIARPLEESAVYF
jgi:microcompartment protein CcmL/EutN